MAAARRARRAALFTWHNLGRFSMVTAVEVVSAGLPAVVGVRPLAKPRERPAIALLEHRVLRGCNVHHTATVFRQRVDFGSFAGSHARDADGKLAARFIQRFAGLDESAPNGRMNANFLARLNSALGIPIEEALFEAILAVELSMTFKMRGLATLDYAEIVRRDSTIVDLIWSTRVPSISRAAARVGLAGLMELLPRQRARAAKSFESGLHALRKRAKRRQWSSSASALALAAEKRGLPCESLGDAYLLLGQGIEQHVVYAPATNERDLERLDARVPTAVITGQHGTSSIAGDVEGLLRAAGKAVGLATSKRTSVCGEPLQQRATQRRDAAPFLLRDPRVGVLVTTASPRHIVRRGLRIDRCDVAAIADRAPDSETSRQALEVILKATTGLIVVSAANAGALAATRPPDLGRIILCASHENDAMRRHVAAGGLAIVRAARNGGERIELRRADAVLVSVPISAVRRSAAAGRHKRGIRTRMFAMAVAFGLGLTAEEIAAAVERRRFLHP
jgi:hypothetical protein